MVFGVAGSAVVSPATKKRYRDQVEADMAEMSSMSESEMHAVIEEQARKRQEDQRKLLEYRSNTQGLHGMTFPLLILSDLTPSCAATRHNLAADYSAAVALGRIEPDGSPTRPVPLHQVSTGMGWTSLTVHRAPALPTAPSTRTGVSLSSTLRGSIPRPRTTTSHSIWQAAVSKVVTPWLPCALSAWSAREQPISICWTHVWDSLLFAGRTCMVWAGQAAGHGAPCTNQAAEVNTIDSRKNTRPRLASPPVLIPPIPELDQQRLFKQGVIH
jgi:hypothetical protein